jgi:hypothetical protein
VGERYEVFELRLYPFIVALALVGNDIVPDVALTVDLEGKRISGCCL